MAKEQPQTRHSEFESEASRKRVGVVSEFWHFLKYNKKWWLVPVLLILFALGLLVFLGGSAAGPFIYTFF
jgi:hypothetical protein